MKMKQLFAVLFVAATMPALGAGEFKAVDPLAPVGPQYKPKMLDVAEIIGPRGGLVSAQFVWTGGGSVQARCGPFRGPGKIPAENVTVRYGSLVPHVGYQDRLTLAPPAQAATPHQSVMVTIGVPRDVPPGEYAATVSCNGREVPLSLTVARYTLPADSGSRKCLVEVVECPTYAASMHQVEPWSEAHWKILDLHWKFLGESGLNQISVLVPLIDQSLNGCPSMVDWTASSSGYTWNYSRVDRYIQTALQHCPIRYINCVIVENAGYRGPTRRGPSIPAIVHVNKGAGRVKEAWPMLSPKWEAVWKPMLTDFLAHMKAKGWARNMLWTEVGDREPSVNPMFKSLEQWTSKQFPDVRWHGAQHSGRPPVPCHYTHQRWRAVPRDRRFAFALRYMNPHYMPYAPAVYRLSLWNSHTPGYVGLARIGLDGYMPELEKPGRHLKKVYRLSARYGMEQCTFIYPDEPGKFHISQRWLVFVESAQQFEVLISNKDHPLAKEVYEHTDKLGVSQKLFRIYKEDKREEFARIELDPLRELNRKVWLTFGGSENEKTLEAMIPELYKRIVPRPYVPK